MKIIQSCDSEITVDAIMRALSEASEFCGEAKEISLFFDPRDTTVVAVVIKRLGIGIGLYNTMQNGSWCIMAEGEKEIAMVFNKGVQ